MYFLFCFGGVRKKKLLEQAPCANLQWVPYDSNISPVENLFDKPDDLDPQPEYPLRTSLTYYKQEDDKPMASLEVLEGDLVAAGADGHRVLPHGEPDLDATYQSPLPPVSTLLILWIFGLMVWVMTFMNKSIGINGNGGSKRPRGIKGRSGKDM